MTSSSRDAKLSLVHDDAVNDVRKFRFDVAKTISFHHHQEHEEMALERTCLMKRATISASHHNHTRHQTMLAMIDVNMQASFCIGALANRYTPVTISDCGARLLSPAAPKQIRFAANNHHVMPRSR